jgi:hypothetical protein
LTYDTLHSVGSQGGKMDIFFDMFDKICGKIGITDNLVKQFLLLTAFYYSLALVLLGIGAIEWILQTYC